MEQAVIFDIDDTLYLRKEPYLRTHRAFFGEMLRGEEDELLRLCHFYKEQFFRERSLGLISEEDMMANRTISTYRAFGIELDREEALRFEKQYTRNLETICVRPAFAALLEELSAAGVPLGILSNGASSRQREKLRAMGIAHYFPEQYTAVSGDIDAAKPDIRLFRHLERKSGLSPRQIWFLGDSLETDAAGARQAGWHMIWLNRRGEPLPEDGALRPDIIADTEEEACAAVRVAAGLSA